MASDRLWNYYLNAKNMIINVHDKKATVHAVKVLSKSGLVIYPTETAYGLACDATNANAIKKIFYVKKRKGKSIPIIVSSVKMIERYAVLDKDARKLMKRFMPGPLTLVVRKKNLPDALSKKTIGFRIPANKFAINLVKKFGKPITATSTNLSGQKSIYNISEIKKIFIGKVDLIIDSGDLPKRSPSTVFDVNSRKLIRKGKISLKQIEKIIIKK